MSQHAVIEKINQADPPRVLDRRRTRHFDFFAMVHLLPFFALVGTGMVVMFYPGWPRIGLALILIGAVYSIGWMMLEVYLGVVFQTRCQIVWLRDRIDRRADAIVQADDPEAMFLQIIPRANWPFKKNATASDVGFLVIDSTGRELRYEGDAERWTIPAESIRSFKVHSIVHEGRILRPFGFSVVLLWIELSDGLLRETPLACQPVRFEFWTPRRKWQRAKTLACAIGSLVDPNRWPVVGHDQFRPLRPLPRIPEAVDFG